MLRYQAVDWLNATVKKWPRMHGLAKFLALSGFRGLKWLAGYVPGVFLGLTMGLFSPARAVLNLLVAVFYPVPRIALFPLVLILVGLNETSNIIGFSSREAIARRL